jgi:hypothetical protein
LHAFGAVTGLKRLHYATLLPPERVCVERVRSRTGHGFTDLDAARHMYSEFANAEVADRHVIKSGVAAEAGASLIFRDGARGVPHSNDRGKLPAFRLTILYRTPTSCCSLLQVERLVERSCQVVLLVSQQNPDGAYQVIPGDSRDRIDVDGRVVVKAVTSADEHLTAQASHRA